MFNEDEKGLGIEESSEFLYLLILIKLCPGDYKTQLKMINKKVDEDNGKALVKGNGWYRKVCRFSSNEFWRNIGFLISDPTFDFRGSMLWYKDGV